MGRVEIMGALPHVPDAQRSAVIIANAAREHEATAKWSLAAGVPTLVEKPIALSGDSARRLGAIARERGLLLAPAHVFLFASYLRALSATIASAGAMEAMWIHWSDPAAETRYGELKSYDSSVPLVVDVLPHIVQLVVAVSGVLPSAAREVDVRDGGSSVSLSLRVGDVPCSVQLGRHSDRRRRLLRVQAERGTFELDFSTEPGSISTPGGVVVSDDTWSASARPLASMLTAFLHWAAGGEKDARLALQPAIRACELIDAIVPLYDAGLASWVTAALSEDPIMNAALEYALTELLQRDGARSRTEIATQLHLIQARLQDARQIEGGLGKELDHLLRPASSPAKAPTV